MTSPQTETLNLRLLNLRLLLPAGPKVKVSERLHALRPHLHSICNNQWSEQRHTADRVNGTLSFCQPLTALPAFTRYGTILSVQLMASGALVLHKVLAIVGYDGLLSESGGTRVLCPETHVCIWRCFGFTNLHSYRLQRKALARCSCMETFSWKLGVHPNNIQQFQKT